MTDNLDILVEQVIGAARADADPIPPDISEWHEDYTKYVCMIKGMWPKIGSDAGVPILPDPVVRVIAKIVSVIVFKEVCAAASKCS